MSTCYANPNPIFQRAMRLISAITNSFPATVTTTFAHNYKTGLIVRLIVPNGLGMTQINNLTGAISVTGDDSFTIEIDTTYFDAFVIPISPNPHLNTCALVIPIGEINSILSEATQNVLP